MWLSDFEEAIAAIKEHYTWSCFSLIQCGVFGDRFIFQPNEMNNFYFVYFRKTGSIIKQFSDTWKHPEHYEVIYKGDE